MQIVFITLMCSTLLALASVISVYCYGRFAKRTRGLMSSALLITDDRATTLDIVVEEILTQHPDQTGMVLLTDNLHAFAARAHSARSAGRSLDIQYYYWKDDLTGGLLAKEVISAADRGARVRLLLDDINIQGNDSAYLALDSHPNIEVRLFNPSRSRANALRRGFELLLRAFSATRRMHNKAWIADGRLAIVGGRNIGDAYFDASDTSNFRDMDLLLLGPSVSAVEIVFDSFWNSAAVIPIRSLTSSREGDLSRLKARLEGLVTTKRAAPYLRRLIQESNTRTMLSITSHWTSDVQVVSDPPEKSLGAAEGDWLKNAIFPLLMSATAQLEIISPYFIPGDEGVRRLRNMTERGVGVSVLTNSLAATDVAAAHGAYANYRKSLLAHGVKLFELKPEVARQHLSLFGSSGASLHTKAFLVDRKAGFIGSFNFDPRSISLNTEMGVFFAHAALVHEVQSVFAEQTAAHGSYRVVLKEDSLFWIDGSEPQSTAWNRDPKASIWRRLGATIIGLLPIESQL